MKTKYSNLTQSFLELYPATDVPIWIKTLAAFCNGSITWDELEQIRIELK